MRLAQGQRHRLSMAGDANKVNVIVHQAPSQDPQIVPLRMFAQDFEVAMAVLIGEEYDLPVVPALRDVMRSIGSDETGPACHC